jgi:hypothetical protein
LVRFRTGFWGFLGVDSLSVEVGRRSTCVIGVPAIHGARAPTCQLFVLECLYHSPERPSRSPRTSSHHRRVSSHPSPALLDFSSRDGESDGESVGATHATHVRPWRINVFSRRLPTYTCKAGLRNRTVRRATGEKSSMVCGALWHGVPRARRVA